MPQKYHLFNCLESLDGTVINPAGTSFEMENERSTHIPETLVVREGETRGVPLFKLDFTNNGFLICNSNFKDVVEKNDLGGLIFEQDLAHFFPRKQ